MAIWHPISSFFTRIHHGSFRFYSASSIFSLLVLLLQLLKRLRFIMYVALTAFPPQTKEQRFCIHCLKPKNHIKIIIIKDSKPKPWQASMSSGHIMQFEIWLKGCKFQELWVPYLYVIRIIKTQKLCRLKPLKWIRQGCRNNIHFIITN